MKKLKLSLNDLEVSTFIPQGRAVYGMDGYGNLQTRNPICTAEDGCYPSLYCTGNSPYVLTCAPDCMTNERGLC